MFSLPDNIFFLESGIYICFGTVLGSLISGGLLLINNSRNNDFQLERERQQRIWQQESDRQNWYREKIFEFYIVSIQTLKKSIQVQYSNTYSEGSDESDTLLNNIYCEFMSEFALVLIGHPSKDNDVVKALVKEILDIALKDPLSARALIIKMMEEDPRINAVNKGYLNNQNSSITPIS